MKTEGRDSTNQIVRIGDAVRYRGRVYVVEAFPPGTSTRGYPRVKLHGLDDPDCDEVGIDRVRSEWTETVP